ncbi:MAG: hypothetical protein M3177_06110, partial [Pseudomonadota bacterium]|nr:hypothetical protein [Pseudomonadota bacterium]
MAACATPYRAPLGLTGGYDDRQIGEGKWQVSFLANGFTRRGFALNAALYRAAELARDHGYPFFQIVQSSVLVGEFVEGEGYVQALGVPQGTGAVIYLTVQGVHSADAPIACENNYRRGCRTLAAAEVLRQLAP